MTKQDVLTALLLLQLDYADGVGDYGPVITAFGEHLARYRTRFYEWEPFQQIYTEEEKNLGKALLPMLKALLLVTVLFLICSHLLSGFFLFAVFYIAAGLVLSKGAGDVSWMIWIAALTIITMLAEAIMELPSVHRYVFAAILVYYLLKALNRYVLDNRRKKRIQKEQKQLRRDHSRRTAAMEADRQKLIELTPLLRKEFHQMRGQLVEECYDLLSKEEREQYCADLPIVFWWDISAEALQKADESFLRDPMQHTDAVWETRWVKRSKVTAFQDAGTEFSPLVPFLENETEACRFYSAEKDHFLQSPEDGYLLDFVSKGTSVSFETRTVQYQEPKYSDMKKFVTNMAYYDLGRKIDEAREEHQLTKSEYQQLRNLYFSKGMELHERLNRTVEKEGMEYYQVKTDTNIWTGQIILTNDENIPGGLAVVDYRCRPYHMFKNLEALHDVKITRVLGSAQCRNPIVMAKIHKVCAECR